MIVFIVKMFFLRSITHFYWAWERQYTNIGRTSLNHSSWNSNYMVIKTHHWHNMQGRRRCKKYYIKGEKRGTMDNFVDDLEAFPDNIKYDNNGHYWIGCGVTTSNSHHFYHINIICSIKMINIFPHPTNSLLVVGFFLRRRGPH